MSVLPSLIAALERAAGDCLVLRSGERPHVVAGETRHDVGTTVLSVKAVEALAGQILSPRGLKDFVERYSVQEVLGVEVADGSLTARAERAGDEIYVELRRHRRAATPANVDFPEPLAAAETARMEGPAHVAEAVEATNDPPHADAAADEPVMPAEPPSADVATPALPVAAVPEPRHDEPIAVAAPEPPSSEAPVIAPAAAVAAEQPRPETPQDPAPAPVFVVERFEPVAAEVPIASAVPEPGELEAMPRVEPVPQEPIHAPVRSRVADPPQAPPVRHAPAAVAASVRDVTDDLDELIADAAERGATALYLRAGQVPAARIDERLQPLDDAVVSASTLKEILASCTAGQDGWIAGEHGEWSREFDLAGLVRCYPFADHAGDGVVIRLAPRSAASGLHRHVPRQVRRACESEDGLVLVAAATQPELLAMLAAVADLAARKRAGYLISLQPAKGLPHPVAGTFVSERALAGSADDVSATIRRAVEEAPDILVVGGVDAPAALEQVILSAAVPGRLVILGVAAPSALRAVESLLAGADRDREPQLRRTLAAALRAAFGYRGLRRAGGGRTTVQDVIVGTSDVRTRLERADFGGIEQLQRQGGDGMRTLDAALARAVARRQVSLRQAAMLAASKSDLVALTRRDARERRALAREHRPEWRQGVLRAI